jgi:hypothetical protein
MHHREPLDGSRPKGQRLKREGNSSETLRAAAGVRARDAALA